MVDPDIDIDPELSGFDMGEIDLYLKSEFTPELEDSETPSIDDPSISKFGDCFLLGVNLHSKVSTWYVLHTI